MTEPTTNISPEMQAFFADLRDIQAVLSKKYPTIAVAEIMMIHSQMVGYGLSMFDKRTRHQLRSRAIQNIDLAVRLQDAEAAKAKRG